MFQLQTLSADRRAYIPHSVGSRDELDQAAANLRATGYRIHKADRALSRY